MAGVDDLVSEWRAMGPAAWAESQYGWIGEGIAPIALLPWQRAVLQAWEAHRDSVSALAISNVKKTGKTLLNAVLLCWRWLVLPGEHFACGNDLDQSAGRQFSMIAEMVKRHLYLKRNVRATGKQLTFSPTGSTLTALAVDAAGNAGANHLTASHTEAWGILYEAGARAWEELTSPPGRFHGLPALRICDSYAGFVGESVTWHDVVDRGLAGGRVSDGWPIFRAGGLMLFHMTGEEAQARCFRGTPEEAAAYYADQQTGLRDGAFRRMHLNERTTNESRFVPPEMWAACFVPEVRPLASADGRRLVLGADASTSRDCTALVGCSYNAAAGRVEQVLCRVWKPERGFLRRGKPTVDLELTIGEEIRQLHRRGLVEAVHYDPYQLHAIALGLEKAGVKMVEMPQTAERTAADQALYDAIVGRTIAHYGDPVLAEHMANAVAVETPRGFRLAKEKTSLKIDAAVALSMAHAGALACWFDMPEELEIEHLEDFGGYGA